MESVDPLGRLFRRIEQRRNLTAHEKDVLQKAVGGQFTCTAGQDAVREGSRPNRSTLLVSGLAIRYTMLVGGRRQITAIHIPGDFVDLHSYPLEIMDHNVGALTECTMAVFPHQALNRIMETEPSLARVLWMLTLLDGAIHREWLAAMGALPATARTAHLLCELYLRNSVVELAKDYSFSFPVSQTDLADVLGLSPVHMNRTIQELRARELIEFERGQVAIHDWTGLVALAQFDSKYLHLKDTVD